MKLYRLTEESKKKLENYTVFKISDEIYTEFLEEINSTELLKLHDDLKNKYNSLERKCSDLTKENKALKVILSEKDLKLTVLKSNIKISSILGLIKLRKEMRK